MSASRSPAMRTVAQLVGTLLLVGLLSELVAHRARGGVIAACKYAPEI